MWRAQRSERSEVFVWPAFGIVGVHAEAGMNELERYVAILDALDELTPRQRSCWSMSHDRRMSYRQIGVTLGISKSTVKGHVDRAEERLVEILEERKAA